MPPDKKTITEQLEELQLQEALAAAEERRSNAAQKKNRSEAIETSLKRDRANQERIQAACWHRKGGKGTGSIYQGNDQNYAIVRHQLSHGPTICICQRCGKIWEPPEVPSKKATPEQKAKYRADLAEYTRAMNFPTDNEPSGTQLFMISRDEDTAA